jgi:hypothetical protein
MIFVGTCVCGCVYNMSFGMTGSCACSQDAVTLPFGHDEKTLRISLERGPCLRWKLQSLRSEAKRSTASCEYASRLRSIDIFHQRRSPPLTSNLFALFHRSIFLAEESLCSHRLGGQTREILGRGPAVLQPLTAFLENIYDIMDFDHGRGTIAVKIHIDAATYSQSFSKLKLHNIVANINLTVIPRVKSAIC